MSVGTLTTRASVGHAYPPSPVDPGKCLLYDDETVNIRDVLPLPVPPQYREAYKRYLRPHVVEGRHVIAGQNHYNDDGDDNHDEDEDGDEENGENENGKGAGIQADDSNAETIESSSNCLQRDTTHNAKGPHHHGDHHEIDPYPVAKIDFSAALPSLYPLENITADWCLFIAGENDLNWFSPVYALEASRRLKLAGRKRKS